MLLSHRISSNLNKKIDRVYNNTSYITEHNVKLPEGSYYFIILSMRTDSDIWTGITWSDGSGGIIKAMGSNISSVSLQNFELTVNMLEPAGCAVLLL